MLEVDEGLTVGLDLEDRGRAEVERGGKNDKMTLMLDSGVRRGADILIAVCLGAQFVFFGRPTLYGAVAGGLPGVKKAVSIFHNEIDLVMGQIGCPNLAELGPDFLWHEDWQRNR